MGAKGQRPQRVPKVVAKIKPLCFELDFSRFDFRKIENIVDQREQRFCGALDQFKRLLVFVFGCAGEQKVRHANDSVHRRANLMAHVGQKFAFGPRRRLGDLFCITQRLLRFSAISHIPEHSLNADSPVTATDYRCFENFDVNVVVAVGMAFDVVKRKPGLQNPSVVLFVFGGQLRAKQVCILFADQIFEAFADTVAEGLVGKHDSAIPIFAKHIDWKAFDQRMVDRPGLVQFSLCPNLATDVVGSRANKIWFPGGVKDQLKVPIKQYLFARRLNDPESLVEALGLADTTQVVHERRQVRLVNRFNPEIWLINQFLDGAAIDSDCSRIEI